MEIRIAQPDELARVGDLTAQAYIADDLLGDDSYYVDELRAAARRGQEADVLVAVIGSAVVGTVTLAAPGTEWAEIARDDEHELRMLAVDPEMRGQGLGDALVRTAIERARAAGVRRLVLSSLEQMRAAQRVYERIGFTRVPDRDWDVRGRPMRVYELALDEA